MKTQTITDFTSMHGFNLTFVPEYVKKEIKKRVFSGQYGLEYIAVNVFGDKPKYLVFFGVTRNAKKVHLGEFERKDGKVTGIRRFDGTVMGSMQNDKNYFAIVAEKGQYHVKICGVRS